MQPSHLAAGTVSCTGNTYCSFALTNTKDQALAAAEELDRELELPEELKIHWTGCPNTCGQAYMGAIGLTGTKARTPEGEMGEGYDITIGGSQGANPQVGQLHRKAVPASAVKHVLKEVLIEHFGAKPRQP
jgi:ferredoxin-nitrite reductase